MAEEGKTLEQRVDRTEWGLEQLLKEYKETADRIFAKLEEISKGQTPACMEHSREITELESDLKSLKKVVYGCEEEVLEGLVSKVRTLQFRLKLAAAVGTVVGTPLLLATIRWLFPHIRW